MENREILSYFDILAFSKCILYFDILLVFRILILKFSRFRSQGSLQLAARLGVSLNDRLGWPAARAHHAVGTLMLTITLSDEGQNKDERQKNKGK